MDENYYFRMFDGSTLTVKPFFNIWCVEAADNPMAKVVYTGTQYECLEYCQAKTGRTNNNE